MARAGLNNVRSLSPVATPLRFGPNYLAAAVQRGAETSSMSGEKGATLITLVTRIYTDEILKEEKSGQCISVPSASSFCR